MSVADRYFDLLIERLAEVNATQTGAIDRAAEACASSIAADKLVFSFRHRPWGACRRSRCFRVQGRSSAFARSLRAR